MYIAFENHFIEGVPWEETAFYERIVDEIKNGKIKWGCSSEREFREVCDDFDELYASLEEHGLLSMQELVKTNVADGQHLLHAHEVCVVLGRDGILMSDEGRHRMFISRILGLKSIPVRVLVRHKAWQEIRNQVAHKSGPITDHPEFAQFAPHPDLQDVTDSDSK